MRLNAPKKITWVVALILGIIGILVHFNVLPPAVKGFKYEFWSLGIGWLLLVLSTWLKGF